MKYYILSCSKDPDYAMDDFVTGQYQDMQTALNSASHGDFIHEVDINVYSVSRGKSVATLLGGE